MSAAGQQLFLKGLRKSVQKHRTELYSAQILARFLGRDREFVTIEDVREAVEKSGRKWTLGNAAGSVFVDKRWEFHGFTRAKRVEAHSRVIRTWRLKKP